MLDTAHFYLHSSAHANARTGIPPYGLTQSGICYFGGVCGITPAGLHHFCSLLKDDHFTKTGSGQTCGKVEKQEAFSCRCVLGHGLVHDAAGRPRRPRRWRRPRAFQVRRRIFCAIMYMKRLFYQDMLGTTIGKALKQECVVGVSERAPSTQRTGWRR
jgi:hypothetical protein